MSSTDENILGTQPGRQLAHNDTQARTQEMAQGFACASTLSEPKLSLPLAVQAQRQVYLTRGVVERFGPTAGCKACAVKRRFTRS